MLFQEMAARATAKRKRNAAACPLMVNDAGVNLCFNSWFTCNGVSALVLYASLILGRSEKAVCADPDRSEVGIPTLDMFSVLVFRSTGTKAIPSWALAMIAATPTPTTFDLAAASGLFLSISTSTSPPRASSPPLQPSDTTQTTALHPPGPPHSSEPAASTLSPAASSSPPPIPSDIKSSPSQTVMPDPLPSVTTGSASSFAISSTSIMQNATPTMNSKKLMRRRRCRRKKDSCADNVPTPYPILYTDVAVVIPLNNNPADNSDARSITKVRQQFLRNELLRAAQENIIHIRNLERQASSARSRAGRILRLLPSRRASSTGSESRDAVILRLREENEMLMARIRELELQAGLGSSRVLGLSDEPPPGYIE
ncbi:hypothetical protein GGX14DRAFT_404985 [Mycena pura]|uniref:Uncharacterized protein n=1 Tax=Mycena pura TaxID=153505 RepID=A0AAD6Y0Z9_9AGAR|nr:hypothetical protein GGX14DRAFT_404985 [Mycena pura]